MNYEPYYWFNHLIPFKLMYYSPYPVSYTHLDVYKRQVIYRAYISYKGRVTIHGVLPLEPPLEFGLNLSCGLNPGKCL